METTQLVHAPDVQGAIIGMIEGARDDTDVGERVALSRTAVALHFTGAEDVAVTLLLDRDPLEAVARALPEAEGDIYASAEQWDAIWTGEYQLAVGIARGEITYRGPVRKFLRTVPILRRLAGEYQQLRAPQTT